MKGIYKKSANYIGGKYKLLKANSALIPLKLILFVDLFSEVAV